MKCIVFFIKRFGNILIITVIEIQRNLSYCGVKIHKYIDLVT
jgi:hypothetical protein